MSRVPPNSITVPLDELQISFVRSSGPGGQNVNKVSSKAVVRWSVAASASLSEEVRARLLSRLASRLTREGELIVASQRFRDAPRNVADALEKLQAVVSAAAARPRPRKPTRPTLGSVRRRREAKQRQAQRKQGRSFRADE
jgi:ribosome-associated protein